MDKAKWFGARLKELREQGGLTQQQLADKAGVGLGAVRDLEQEKNGPTWATVITLADALGVAVTAFLEEPASKPATGKGRPRKPAGSSGPGSPADQPELPASEPPGPSPADQPQKPAGSSGPALPKKPKKPKKRRGSK